MSSKRNTFSLRMSRYPEKDLFFQYIWLIPLWCITNLKISPKMIDFTHNLLLNQEITRSHWRLWHLHSKSTNRIREIKINKPYDQRVMWLKGHWSGSSLDVTTLPGLVAIAGLDKFCAKPGKSLIFWACIFSIRSTSFHLNGKNNEKVTVNSKCYHEYQHTLNILIKFTYMMLSKLLYLLMIWETINCLC